MKNIDFLPKRYHEQGAKRKSHIWRILLLVLFGGICAATGFGQYVLHSSVADDLSKVEPLHTKAVAANQTYDQLQVQLRDASAEAELLTFLRHPWPRTQILAGIVQPLTESIVLTEMQLRGESRRFDQSPSRPRKKKAAPNQLAAQGDLLRLRQEYGSQQTVVRVNGETTDIGALHQYVGNLADRKLFASAQLVSLESVADPTRSHTSQFVVQVVVRRGYSRAEVSPLTKTVESDSSRPDGDA